MQESSCFKRFVIIKVNRQFMCRTPFAPPPLALPPDTYHNHWEESLPVMEGPQSHSKEHQVGEQECKWKSVFDKSIYWK